MRSLLLIAIFLLFMVSMDLYTLRGIQLMGIIRTGGSRLPVVIYWAAHLLFWVILTSAGLRFQSQRDPSAFFGIAVIMGVFLMLYLPKVIFNLAQLSGDMGWLIGRINRLCFLIPGAVLGLLLMGTIAMGMIRGRTHVKVFTEEVRIKNLPDPFSGLRIVQLSDLHLAGFYHQPDHIAEVVDRVNRLEPDLILFTGDLVHNFAEEADPFTEILSGLRASLGKYAVMGNHDYGRYFRWDSEEQMEENLARVKAQFRACGFDLLLNEHRRVDLDGHSIEVVGVENWGKPPFPQLGDLGMAMEGTEPGRTTILLSHDPSHWDQEVKGMEEVELTLSGHTHGMQMGIEWGGFRWSPSKWIYPRWAGLYRENGQYLYVNRGIGFTGFPGRVGIRPEITLITLRP